MDNKNKEILRLQLSDMASKTDISKGLKKAQRIVNPLTKRLFDLKEAGIYLGRPVYSVRTLIWNGALPVIKDGRKLYLDIVDMDTYIKRNKTTII